MNVLFVDDDDLISACFTCLLSEEGFEVIEAENAEKALAVIERGYAPGVLVTDLNFGSGMSGLELIETVRRRQPSIRAVLISGQDGVAGLHPSDRFLSKPFRANDLLRLIEDMDENNGARLHRLEGR